MKEILKENIKRTETETEVFNEKGKDEDKAFFNDPKKVLKAVEGHYEAKNTMEVFLKENEFMNNSGKDTLSIIKKLEKEIVELENEILKDNIGFEEYKSNYDIKKQPPRADYLINEIKRKRAEIEQLIDSN